MSRRVSRRSLLGGLAGGTALLGRPWRSFGQTATPARLLVLYMPNCSIRASWVPKGGRNVTAGTGDATQFTLGPASATLEPVRQLMTVVAGLDLKNIGGDPHGSGLIRMMTGGTIRAGEKARDPGIGTLGDGNLPLLPSFDQVLEDRSPRLKGVPFRSLQLAADTRADDGRTDVHLRAMSYDLTVTPMPPDNEPVKTFSRVFASVMPGATTPEQRQAAERALADDRSVLDFITGDLGRLAARLPADQRPKLDSHLEAVRELERSLARTPGGTPTVTLPTQLETLKPNSSANHQKIVGQFLTLTRLAFQLDLTRVVTFMFASGNSQVSLGDFLPGYAKGGIHPLAHDYNADAMTAATRFYCDLVAKYVLELKEARDVDGSSLLDNTVVALVSEVGQYHEFSNVPVVLFGGAALGLTGGRCLQYTGRTPADVWTAVAAAFGVPLATFGDPAYSKGPLPELFA
jgi:hypothetical protein